MITYISLLRGINVSGKNPLKMEDLKLMYEKLGTKNVKTYIQNGNVIFQSEETNPKTLKNTISEEIKKVFRFDVPVIVITLETLQNLIINNPFTNNTTKDIASHHITLFAENPFNWKK